MTILDKNGVLGRLGSDRRVSLELGCGERKRLEGAIGIDHIDSPAVDVVGDVMDVLKTLPDECVEVVHSHHFIEHLDDLTALMDELNRVLVPGATIDFTVPHFSNPYVYSDHTHRSHFGLYSMCYFAEQDLFKREVPSYGRKRGFTLLKVELVFKSTRPFYGRHMIKWTVGRLVNLSYYTKELYEEMFCYLIPCYEVRYLLRRR